MKLELADWTLEFDPETNRKIYQRISKGTGCDCLECKNFIALGPKVYPEGVRKIFDTLGVDPEKPAEIYHNAKLDSGLHSYGGWYHLVAKVLEEYDAFRHIERDGGYFDLKDVGDDIYLGFTDRKALVKSEFLDYDIIQMEISVSLPWVLEMDYVW